MEIKAIRKLPELTASQEWACEQGCDVIRPKFFENVYSESYAHDGSSVRRESERYYTCQYNHKLCVWDKGVGDYAVLHDDFYKVDEPTVVEANGIQQSIDLLNGEVEELKSNLIDEECLSNEGQDYLDALVDKAMLLGQYYDRRDQANQSPWVQTWDKFPELPLAQNNEDVLTSEKEVFFKLRNMGGIYHGWYMARPKEDEYPEFGENVDDDIDIEYEYFFNANVGDELFTEDSVECWMYCPQYEGE